MPTSQLTLRMACATIRAMRVFHACVLVSASLLLSSLSTLADLHVECGFRGFTKAQAWFPVKVSGCAPGTPIEASLIEKQNYRRGSEQVRFRALGAFPTGQGQPAVVMCRKPQDVYGDVVLRVKAFLPDGKIEEKDVKVTTVQNQDTFVLTLSDTPNVFDFLGSIHLPNRGVVCVVPCDRDRFPSRRMELSGVDVVLLDGITGGLSPAQWETLEEWVVSGGTVILTGRALLAERQRPGSGRGGLFAAARIESDDTTWAESPTLSAAIGPFGNQLLRVSVWPLTVPARCSILQDTAGVLLAGEDVGAGRVVVLGFDWQNPELRDRTFSEGVRQAMWDRVLRLDRKLHSGAPGLALVTPDQAKTRFLLSYIAVFLFAYVLILGPLNWVILRSRKKLEWSVVTVPAGAVVFSLAAFAIGLALRSDKVIQREASIVIPGSGRGYLRGSVGVLSPDRHPYTMQLASPSGLFGTLDQDRGSPASRRDLETYSFDGLCRLSGVRIGMWSMRYLWTDDVIPLGGDITATASCTSNTVTVTVSNDLSSDLRNAWVFVRWNRVYLGDIPAGTTTNVVLQIRPPSRALFGRCKNCSRYHGSGTPWGAEDEGGAVAISKEIHEQLTALHAAFGGLFEKPILVAWQDEVDPLVDVDRPDAHREGLRMVAVPMPLALDGPDLDVPVGVVPMRGSDGVMNLQDASFVGDIRLKPYSARYRLPAQAGGESVPEPAEIPGMSFSPDESLALSGRYMAGRATAQSFTEGLLPFKGGEIETTRLTFYWDASEPTMDENLTEGMLLAYDWAGTNWVELAKVKAGERHLDVPDPQRFVHGPSGIVRTQYLPAGNAVESGRGSYSLIYLEMAHEGRRKTGP